jgi:two-component system, chemotaxis family, protein-glutamate methylesterase/glutaminase
MAFQFIAVGASLGGLNALTTVLGGLPKDFPLPIAVVQHRSNEDSASLASLLGTRTQLPVVEVDDKETIREGHVYICPSNYHLAVEGNHFALSADAPVLCARPSIDVLFESAAESFRDSVIGILLTGMSKDGTAGLKRIKEVGGYTVVQDPFAAEGQVMPQAAIDSVAVDKILPLEDIACFLTTLCAGQRTEV